MAFDNTKYKLLVVFAFLMPILPSFTIISADLLIALFLVLEIRLMVRNKDYRNLVKEFFKHITSHKIFFTLLLLNILMYLSAIYAYDPFVSIAYASRITVYLFFTYIIFFTLDLSKQQLEIISNSFILSNIIVGVVALIEFIMSGHFLNAYTEVDRVTSFLGNSNVLGMYAVMSFFLSIYLLFKYKENKKLRRFYIAASFLILCSIITCESRNALLGLTVGVFLLLIIYNKKYIKYSIFTPILLLIIPFSRQRIFELFDLTQNISRIKLWKTSMFMIEDHPIGGVGFNNFRVLYSDYVMKNPDELMHSSTYTAYHPHNLFLKIQTELGILGTLLLVLVIILSIIGLYRLYKSSLNKLEYLLISSLLAVVGSFLFMNLFDSFLDSPKAIFTLILISALCVKEKVGVK